MIITKAFRYRIYPTREQRDFLARHFGACRFVYNHFLDLRSTGYKENRRSISGLECKRMFVPLKADSPWLKEMNSRSLQEAVLNLDRAHRGFFRGPAKYPAFKKKRGPQSFTVPQHFRIDGQLFHIPKLKTGIRMKLHRNAATVIKKAGQGMPDIKPVEKRASILSFKRKGKFSSVKQETRTSFEMHRISTP